MKTNSMIKLAALMTLVNWSGCTQNSMIVGGANPPEAKVDGDQVLFPTNAPQLASITTEAAESRKLAVTYVTGRLYWNDDMTVRVFTPVAGRVTKVYADIGQPVAAGSALAEIDSPDFAQALANARTAEANLVAADRAFTRTKDLQTHGAAAQKDVEAAEAAYVAALAERDRSESVLANYGGNNKSTNSIYILRSPLAGIVVEKNINPGQELRADLMLANAPNLFAPHFIVSNPTRLWLQVDVAEADIPALQPGLPIKVMSKAFPNRVFDGVIDKVADEMDPNTRSVKVRGLVKNPDKLLKAEMYVTVNVVRDVSQVSSAGVEVPASALFMKGDDSYLFIEQSPGNFQRQRVKVGVEKDNKVPVFEGVSPGQRVVSEGALLLQALVEPAG